MTIRIAACSCGQLSVRTQGEPTRVSLCHCLACQRRTGSVFGAQARFPLSCVTITGYALEGYDTDSIGIPVGAFADPAFPAPTVSVYEERMHGWVLLPEGIEHMY